MRIYNTALTASQITADRAAGVSLDNQAPTAPSVLTTSNITHNSITLTWTAASDNVSVTGYDVYRYLFACTSPPTGNCADTANVVGQVSGTTTTFTDNPTTDPTNPLSPLTKYGYYVKAHDAVPNTSVASNSVTPTTTAFSDTTPPTASLTTPTNNSTVSGTVNVTATATDNIGVAKVEFFVDGNSTPVATDTASPYAYSWDTTGLTNVAHTISVKATDTAGNVSTVASVSVTPQNGDVTKPTAPTAVTATAASSTSINLSWSGATDNTAVTSYKVFRYLFSAGITTAQVIATPTTTTYSDTGLTANTKYGYYVSSGDTKGE
ncbi:MAG: Ig-like domain-containing protein [Candidatus Saccharibacteria bacterium]